MKALFTKSMFAAILFVMANVSVNAETRYLAAGSADQTVEFQNLVNLSVTGDIIILRSGNHYLNGTVVINKNGITVRGENGNTIRKSGNVSCVDITGSNNTIDNLYIDGGNRPEPCARLFGNYNLILNCTFRNSGNSGLLIHQCHHNTIQGCKAFYNYMVGISQWAHSDGTVRDCQMYENGAEGLTIDGATHNNQVFGNWIHKNNLPHRGVGGIGVDASNGAWVHHNTIDFNGSSGITLQNNLCCGIDGMRVYDNPNISNNQQCAVMFRNTQPITNFGFWGNTCVGNPGGIQCSTSSRPAGEQAAPVTQAVEEKKVQLYPNPIKNVITISNAKDIRSVQLYNTMGQLIYSKQPESRSTLTIDITKQSSGVYILKLEDKTGSITTTRVVKE